MKSAKTAIESAADLGLAIPDEKGYNTNKGMKER
jgi:hypothetical protein